MVYASEYESPLGRITLAGEGDYLVGLWFEGQKYFGGTVAGGIAAKGDGTLVNAAKRWLDRYFAGLRPAVTDLPLAPAGSGFRQAVWKTLCEIPYGEYMTYGEIAVRMAADMGKDRMSAQAVGGAVGHNPLSIIIPCHRVVGAQGSLTGYAGGIGKKLCLLEHEGADTSRLFIPAKGTAL
ncbi:MAG TPA: methylated-DNA--[protein]-cysteine S-methyltransferase [Patescibacteria group bacterium]|nr:methylated-DNA--[protein]-cysteine S-methyltransferase [Patescibacteria group bacterium]